MLDASDIGHRLGLIAIKYGGSSKLARLLGISPQQMNAYLSERRIPGNKMQQKLRQLGCDIEWLMTGITAELRPTLSASDRQLLEYLKSIGIDSIEKAQAMLSPEALAQDLALVLREKLAKYQIKSRQKKGN